MDNSITEQPKSLRIFFGTEMWERYGFYVVQTLLALYLVLQLKWDDERTYALVGSFTALTYISPVIGGWIADRFLGQRAAILLGIFSLFASYIGLAAIDGDLSLTLALAGVAVGTGLLKPNISSLLGNEYPQGSPLREGGFTIFYMGITLGIVLGTTIPSQLSLYFGWPIAFLSAAIGIILAFFVFVFGVLIYKIEDYNPPEHNWKTTSKALGLIIGLWLVSFYVLYSPRLANILFVFVVTCSATYLFYSVKKASKEQARKNLIISLLCLISVIFWTFYFQMFLSLTLFIERVVQPSLFGLHFPPPYYVTVQSLGMLFFGYFLSKLRLNLNLIERTKNIALKFIAAIFFIGLAYIIITLVNHFFGIESLIPPIYILPAYILISLAELLLSPVGLSAITILASRANVSTMMGIFFVSLGLGGFLAGKLASITAIPPGQTNLSLLRAHYSIAFTEILLILFLASLLCLCLYGIIKVILKQMDDEKAEFSALS